MPDAAEPMTSRLIDSLYTEAMVLADEARFYFDDAGRTDRAGLDPLTRVSFSCESLKVTTRLMHIVAWLLTRRALATGEIPPATAARPPRRLGKATESDPEIVARLPEAGRALIASSSDLYARVKRLEDTGGFSAAPSPARLLMSRLERSL